MVYVVKTTSTLKLIYTIIAGLVLLVWVLLFGASTTSGEGLTTISKAYADTPGSCQNCGSDDGGGDNNCGNGGYSCSSTSGCGSTGGTSDSCGSTSSCCDSCWP